VNCCSSYLSLWFVPLHPFPENQHKVYIYTVCKGGWGHRSGGSLRQTNTCRKVPLHAGKFILMTTFCFGVYKVNKSMTLGICEVNRKLGRFSPFWFSANEIKSRALIYTVSTLSFHLLVQLKLLQN
jgi:hypothetical protein